MRDEPTYICHCGGKCPKCGWPFLRNVLMRTGGSGWFIAWGIVMVLAIGIAIGSQMERWLQ